MFGCPFANHILFEYYHDEKTSQTSENSTNINLLKMQAPFSVRHSSRGIFCTRTLNLRSISVVGYDMDYTLIHYNVMVLHGPFS